MPGRPHYPVSIFVEDIEKNLDYFTHVLGFREEERYELPSGEVAHALVMFGTGAKRSGVALASIPRMVGNGDGYDYDEFGRNLRKGALGNGVVLDFVVPDVRRYHQAIAKRGALIDEPPTDQAWGERTISVRTPDGYYLTFAQKLKGAKLDPAYGRIVRAKPR